MIKILKNVVTLVLFSLLTTTVNAGLIVTDLKDPGDSVLIKDTETGYDWIRLYMTTGNESQIESLLSGDFAGFSVATYTQVQTLTSQFSVPLGFQHHPGASPERDSLFEFQRLLGVSDYSTCGPSCESKSALGSFKNGAEWGKLDITFMFQLNPDGHIESYQGISVFSNSGVNAPYIYSSEGVFLVRTEVVPEPSVLGLFGLALLATVRLRKR